MNAVVLASATFRRVATASTNLQLRKASPSNDNLTARNRLDGRCRVAGANSALWLLNIFTGDVIGAEVRTVNAREISTAG